MSPSPGTISGSPSPPHCPHCSYTAVPGSREAGLHYAAQPGQPGCFGEACRIPLLGAGVIRSVPSPQPKRKWSPEGANSVSPSCGGHTGPGTRALCPLGLGRPLSPGAGVSLSRGNWLWGLGHFAVLGEHPCELESYFQCSFLSRWSSVKAPRGPQS